MKKLIYILIISLFSTLHSQAKVFDTLHGHLIAPEYIFINADASEAISVGLADIVLWDLGTSKPIKRIDLGNIIKGYNPWDTEFKIKAVPSPTFKELLLEVWVGENSVGYVFDMNTGSFSIDDKVYNDKLFGFDYKGNYYSIDRLRKKGEKPSSITRLIKKPNGNTSPKILSSIVTIWPMGYSLDGEIIYGEDGLKDRLIYLNTETLEIEKTKLKYNYGKYRYKRFDIDNLFYTSKWMKRVPNDANWVNSFYHIDTKKLVTFNKEFPMKGPYTFSDDGKYGIYLSKENSDAKMEVVIKDVFTNKEISKLKLPAGSTYLNQSRMVTGEKQKLFLFTNSLKSLNTYNLNNAELISSLDLMTTETLIAMNKAAREQVVGKKETVSTGTSSNNSGSTTSTLNEKDDYDYKNFLVNFSPIKHFYFNLSNAQNLQGRDITNLPYTQKKYFPPASAKAKIKSVLALGKLAQCDGTVIIFGCVRAIYNNTYDKTLFFMEKIDVNGKSLKFEDVGQMVKLINGGAFVGTTDLGVYQANDKVAIVTEQRERIGKSNKFSNKKRTIMIDQLNCEIWDKK